MISIREREGKEVYDLYGAVLVDEEQKYSTVLYLHEHWYRFADDRVECISECCLPVFKTVIFLYIKRFYPSQQRKAVLDKITSLLRYYVCWTNSWGFLENCVFSTIVLLEVHILFLYSLRS